MNRELENNLMQQYVNLVISQAMSFKPNTISDFEDLLQAGGIGLLQAIRTYDADKDTQFSTYATTLIRNEILNECEKFQDKQNKQHIGDIATTPSEKLWEFEPDSLTAQDRDILSMRLSGHNFQTIGKKFSRTKAWASYQLQQIFKKIQDANE